MLDKLADIETRYEELERLLSDPEVMNDYTKIAEYSKERSNLQEIVDAFRLYKGQIDELEGARLMVADETDPDLLAMAGEEVAQLEASTDKLYEELKVMLLPKDPRDEKNVIMEIRAGAGGDESGLFAADLFRMYSYYATARNWKIDVIDQSDTGVGGFKEIKFEIRGKGAFSRLKFESGVHRVQRVPETESQGRVHTSTVTVAVLAEMDEVDVALNMNDVRVDVYRSGGAGGQSVNTTDSAVRFTHIPTGIVVAVQDERSQLQNKEKAKAILIARLYEIEVERQRSAQENERRSQVGTGDRSEKIRTYNYPQNRVTDHRINLTSYNLPAVMEGGIDEFIDELITRDQAEKLAAGESIA
ncbi:MAG: peptide chain release factor 1 [Chloroflexi bacterium]|uniref:peptide chain release factor 1 n=1 Tax=Candidatus Flexifilum breve TaxID=3140694 RepID=UPI0031364269|nr:peptide chain release factor 1 [Chloroflexota bacterium]